MVKGCRSTRETPFCGRGYRHLLKGGPALPSRVIGPTAFLVWVRATVICETLVGRRVSVLRRAFRHAAVSGSARAAV